MLTPTKFGIEQKKIWFANEISKTIALIEVIPFIFMNSHYFSGD